MESSIQYFELNLSRMTDQFFEYTLNLHSNNIGSFKN